MAPEVLTNRQLNRALLGRQLLLERSSLPIADALEHLVGMQAQVPFDPYFGLWSRLDGFDPHELGGMAERREVVRTSVMRGTIHLVTARDCLRLRAVMDPVMRATFRSGPHAKAIAGAPVDEVVAAAERMLAVEEMSRAELGKALAERWPEFDGLQMAHAAHFLLPLVQVPPRGVWGKRMQPKWMTVESFLGEDVDWDADPGEAVLRYLRSYGPATTKDVRAWSYRTGLKDVIDLIRSQLRVFQSEEGTELLDVEDGLFPDPETPAPVRFLPEYDNATLSFADRARVLPEADGRRQYWKGTLLVDGFAAGTWRRAEGRGATDLEVGLWRKLSSDERGAVEAEGRAMLAWAEEERAGEVRVSRLV